MLFSRREFWEEMVLVGEIVFCSLTRYRILGQMLGQVGAKLLLWQGDIPVGDPLGRASVWWGWWMDAEGVPE